MRFLATFFALSSCLTVVLSQGKGATDPKGATSAKGPKGPTSAKGPKGPISAKGPKGPASAKGPKGAKDQTQCSAVHFVVARGSGEPQGVGMLRGLVNSVAQSVSGVTSEAIVYPAQLDFNNLLSYVSSERSGVSAGKSQITAYVRRCPKSKIVVTGVSQVRNHLAGTPAPANRAT
jgi:Cutinase